MQPCFAHFGKRTTRNRPICQFEREYQVVDKILIAELLKKYFDIYGGYTIADDGKVSTSSHVQMSKPLKKLPIEFDYVGSSFVCSRKRLVSLKGSPNEVGGFFMCGENKLTSLEGAPKYVGGNFGCRKNLLTSLEGLPDCQKHIGVDDNPYLVSLKGLYPSFTGPISLTYSPKLPLLRTLGSQKGVIIGYEDGKDIDAYIAHHIQNILNQFKGLGKRGVLPCSQALMKLEKELQLRVPTISLRGNIRW
jgi:hypothetical protein